MNFEFAAWFRHGYQLYIYIFKTIFTSELYRDRLHVANCPG